MIDVPFTKLKVYQRSCIRCKVFRRFLQYKSLDVVVYDVTDCCLYIATISRLSFV